MSGALADLLSSVISIILIINSVKKLEQDDIKKAYELKV